MKGGFIILKKILAIIPRYGTDYTKEFTAAFGNATVNEGILAPKFSFKGNKGDCHLSQLGYEILAYLVCRKGQELKYWN